jgi:hypothetical protein
LLVLYLSSCLVLIVFGVVNLVAIRHGYNSAGVSWLFLFAGVGTAILVWQVVERALLFSKDALPQFQKITVTIVCVGVTVQVGPSESPRQSPVAPKILNNAQTPLMSNVLLSNVLLSSS